MLAARRAVDQRDARQQRLVIVPRLGLFDSLLRGNPVDREIIVGIGVSRSCLAGVRAFARILISVPSGVSDMSIVLFVITPVLIGAMFLTGWHVYNQELAEHGRPGIGALGYLTSGHFLSTMFENWEHLVDAEFWFESFQNWQSEFMSTGALVVPSIFLRFRGSPELKPVAAPHPKTGR